MRSLKWLYGALSMIFCVLFAFLGFLQMRPDKYFFWVDSLGFAIIGFSHILGQRKKNKKSIKLKKFSKQFWMYIGVCTILGLVIGFYVRAHNLVE